jgi:hypothetical protein
LNPSGNRQKATIFGIRKKLDRSALQRTAIAPDPAR